MTKQELTLIVEKLCTVPLADRTVAELVDAIHPEMKDKILTTGDAWNEETVADWYQSSIDERIPPVWTDRHLEELTHDFYLIPKPNTEDPFV